MRLFFIYYGLFCFTKSNLVETRNPMFLIFVYSSHFLQSFQFFETVFLLMIMRAGQNKRRILHQTCKLEIFNYPADISLFNVNNKNNEKTVKLSSFEQIPNTVLEFPLLTLNRQISAGPDRVDNLLAVLIFSILYFKASHHVPCITYAQNSAVYFHRAFA